MNDTDIVLDGGIVAYTVKYDHDGERVTVSGSPPTSHLLTAVGFKNLTVYQAAAMELGIRIFKYLETRKYPLYEDTRLQYQPGAELNYKDD